MSSAKSSQLTTAKLHRLHRTLRSLAGHQRSAAALASAIVAASSRDLLLITGEQRPTPRFRAVPDLGFAAGVASQARKGTAVVAFAPAYEDEPRLFRYLGSKKIPIVMVVSQSRPEDRLPTYERDLFPSIRVEAADSIALLRVFQESLLHARLGAGPTLIACESTLRIGPLKHMENYLRQKKLWRGVSSKSIGESLYSR